MKKLSNILIILAVLATPCMVIQAYQVRGYFAVGGEWFFALVPLLAIVLAKQFKLFWKECFK